MQVRDMLAKAMELPKSKVTENEKLANLERWDSLAILNFMALVDEHYGVTLAPDQLLECRSVSDVELLVAKTPDRADAFS